ncbi:MAG TPA: efflux RND transporter periplasmic adaptor subunit [Leptolyngbyaceae cyanobacterium]
MVKRVVLGLAASLLLITSCSQGGRPQAQAGGGGGGGGRPEQGDGKAVVDVAVAQPGQDANARTYTGSTAPVRQVSLRSQSEGQLVSLAVDVGDPVQPGQTLAQVDPALLQAAVGQANAELAARQFEVSQAEAQVADARTLVEQARAEYQQAASDASRLQALATQGAVSAQEAQRSQTTQRTTLQALRSAEEQVRTRQQAVATAKQRVEAQQALLEQGRSRLSNSTLTAPLAGVVLQRLVEPGDFLQAGQPVLELGNFSEVEVQIQVSDRDRALFSLGQPVQVKLDAFPKEALTGRITRISPVADSASRLIPIEITVPNPEGKIGSGLLARVTVSANPNTPILVPESALETGEASDNTVFVVATAGETPTVEPRTVRLGQRSNGQVEILDGLKPGESYVIRSNQPLQPGQAVERSLLSEPS